MGRRPRRRKRTGKGSFLEAAVGLVLLAALYGWAMGDMRLLLGIGVVSGLALILAVWWGLRTRWARLSAARTLVELRAMSPAAFEEWVGERFRNMGYRVKTVGQTGDHGVDLVLKRGDEKAVVQCKRYLGTVGEPVLRDVFGTMYSEGAEQAYVVTTGTFTQAAERWAKGKPIELWDGERLIQIARQEQG